MALASFVGLSSLAAETVELKLEFPPPLVISTPAPIKVPHLEQPGRKPPKIMVPAEDHGARRRHQCRGGEIGARE